MGRGPYTGEGVTKAVELRRHTDTDGDLLTPEGVQAALEVGAGLDGPYELFVSSGAQRSTQTLACFLARLGAPVPGGVIVESGLRSASEGRWREIYAATGKPDLESFRAADPEFVEAEEAQLGAALRRIFAALSEGGRALAVGHSPTNEAAVHALTGQVVTPLAKGAGVIVVLDGGDHRVEALS
jgi:broad specificity phosphatase PhoE